MKIGLVYRDCLQEGGYPRDIRWLSSSLVALGNNVTLFTNRGIKRDGIHPKVHFATVEDLGSLSTHFDLVHVFGIFIRPHWDALQKLHRMGIPTVLSFLSHLSPYAMRRHKIGKCVLLRFLTPNLYKVTFHTFSAYEESNLASLFPNNKRFRASLGIFPVDSTSDESSDSSATDDIVFFGRNDVFQKGIDVLLDSFGVMQRGHSSACTGRLVIAGRAWRNSREIIEESVRRNALQDRVVILGDVDEKTKWHILRRSQYLVYTSRFDGPPRPIREAISVGTPLIVSPETNMSELVTRYSAGISVPLDPEVMGIKIHGVLKKTDHGKELREGVKKLREHLRWERVAKEYISGYHHALSNA